MILSCGMVIHSAQAQKTHERSILVLSANFNSVTDKNVNCNEFVNSLNSQLKMTKVISSDSLQLLEICLKKMKWSEEKKELNVRAKFLYMNSDQKDVVICMDNEEIMVDGKLIERDPQIISFFKSMVPKDQLAKGK